MFEAAQHEFLTESQLHFKVCTENDTIGLHKKIITQQSGVEVKEVQQNLLLGAISNTLHPYDNCLIGLIDPLPSPLPGSTYGHSSDSTLGGGCVVLGEAPQPTALLGSAYGHSSDSSLGIGCVVTGQKKGTTGNKNNGK